MIWSQTFRATVLGVYYLQSISISWKIYFQPLRITYNSLELSQ